MQPHRLLPSAIHMSDVSFFWEAPRTMACAWGGVVPWAVTANLAAKYSFARFGDGFPLGGEWPSIGELGERPAQDIMQSILSGKNARITSTCIITMVWVLLLRCQCLKCTNCHFLCAFFAGTLKLVPGPVQVEGKTSTTASNWEAGCGRCQKRLSPTPGGPRGGPG